jgi:DNA invertase Pin-like site-specific DNA recombinase
MSATTKTVSRASVAQSSGSLSRRATRLSIGSAIRPCLALIRSRSGPASLLNRIEGNGVKVVLVEDASRFARDLMAQELGIGLLIRLGMRVITANGDDLTVTDDAMKVAMRQIAGTFAQLEKARLVAKLRPQARNLRQVRGAQELRRGTA